jgi:ABC-type transport system substrate-binding protein
VVGGLARIEGKEAHELGRQHTAGGQVRGHGQSLYNHDLDKAKALLNAAGLSNISFELIHSNRDPAYPQIAQIIQGDLASIGVSMSINQMEGAGMLARMNGHQFQVYLAGDVWANFLPVTVDFGRESQLPVQQCRLPRRAVRPSGEKSLSAEVEPSKQKQLYAQINDFLLDQSFEIPIATSPTRALAVANLRRVGHRRNDVYTFTDAWLT